jgi:Peptidase A4 family
MRLRAARTGATGRIVALSALVGSVILLLATVAKAAAAISYSTNWSGYVARTSATVPSFSRIAGSWREPSATCVAGRESYSAVWVGLGGYSSGSRALEQIGSDADCAHDGTPRYTTWFELLPAAPVALHVRIHPGDELTASVTVHGRRATLRLADLTTGSRFTTTKTLASVDLSSAEWIVEAPSLCGAAGNCQTLPLADFGTVGFSSASATARGHASTLAQPAWPLTELVLRQTAASSLARGGPGRTASLSLLSATPSAVLSVDGAFSVAWSERAGAAGGGEEGPSAPTLPAFSGGPPP